MIEHKNIMIHAIISSNERQLKHPREKFHFVLNDFRKKNIFLQNLLFLHIKLL